MLMLLVPEKTECCFLTRQPAAAIFLLQIYFDFVQVATRSLDFDMGSVEYRALLGAVADFLACVVALVFPSISDLEARRELALRAA
jgi:hypothetical protein